MPLNREATKAARRTHNQGVKLLRTALARGWKGEIMTVVGRQRAMRDTGPHRTRKGCPPDRTVAQKTRHLRRKRARAARRLNRR